MDNRSKEARSENMSHIPSKDTSIEMKVRKWLFHQGYRYRKNVKSLPGKPDIVLNSYKTVIFIHGCFWHRHAGCKDATTPKTRTDFWNEKFERNVANDNKHLVELEKMGYRVIVIWECEITKNFEATMKIIATMLGEPKHSQLECTAQNQ